MTILQIAQANLLSPPVLCFVLGAVAVLARSDLKLPEPIFAGLSIYLMLSIGLRGGAEIAHEPLAAIAAPAIAAVLLGCIIPLWCYAGLRRFAGLDSANAAALAAHYGSVSAVTFAAVTAMLDQQGVRYEGYVAALLALMEVPAIVVAIGLARVAQSAAASAGMSASGGVAVLGGGPVLPRIEGPSALAEVLSSKSVLLLVGGLVIGAVSSPAAMAKVKPVFTDLFQGALCLFLLDLGRVAASRVGDFGKVGARLAGFALVTPVLHGALGVALAYWLGLSEGGAVVLGTLAASASYIAAPAAVRLALPDANPGYYLTCSLGITFPFNILLGLPLYQAMARAIYG